METELEAVNGRRVRAIEVFAHALRFFREHALKVHFQTSLNALTWVKPHVFNEFYQQKCLMDHVLGGEGPVVICARRRGDQMGDHCPCCVETTSQTVHERGGIPGRHTHAYTEGQIVDMRVYKINTFLLFS